MSLFAGAVNYRIDLVGSNASFLGESALDDSGLSVANAGDVNGDGYDDILIGAYSNDEAALNAGQVYLFFGKSTGWAMDTGLSSADASFLGESAFDWAGFSVAGAGDVNGDGYDDILIGAYGDDDGGTSAGQTYLILGKPTGWTMDTDLSSVDASFWGEDSFDYSGFSVASAGDVNGDWLDDILIGAYGDDDGGSSAGQTYLILGKSTGWAMDTDLSAADASFWGEDSFDSSGFSVASAGDVNGDGLDDILIGAYGDEDGGSSAGQTYLILGKSTGWAMDTDLSASDASFWGEVAFDFSGYSVAGAGDVNDDGFDDILIGAYGNDEPGALAGQTYLVFGAPAGWAMDTDLSAADASFWGEDAADYSGWVVAGAGDVNNDGFDDILIGAYGDDDGGSSAGQSYLIPGGAAGWTMDIDLVDAPISFVGEAANDFSGYSLAGAGDVNGDGFNEILIGAYGNDDSASSAGQSYLFFFKADPPTPNGLQAQLTADGRSILVSWGPPGYWNDQITGYKLYRSMDGSNYNEIDSFPPWVRAYNDGNVMLGQTYYYGVRALYSSGAPSEMSEIVSLVCDKDTDMDGIGNSIDDDDDGDGIPDNIDAGPLAQDGTLWGRTDVDLSSFGIGFIGEDSDDKAGFSVAGAGDVNGDGFDDLIIGAYGDEEGGGANAGQVYLFFGGPSFGRLDIDLSAADASFWGEATSDNAGYSIAGAGDVNGDGFDDILIGATGNDEGGASAGQSYLIFGKASGWHMDENLSNSDASFLGESAGDNSGFSVSGAGDVNGDGFDDILIGAWGDDDGGSSAGQTYLILGRSWGWSTDLNLSTADASFWGEDGFDYAGTLVAGGGDVNGDGFDDILIGAYGDDDGGSSAGQTYLILGKAKGWAMDTDLSAVDASFWGEDASDLSGRSASLAGDVNGDGLDDILIGAYQDEDGGLLAGQTYLIFGQRTGWAMDTDLSASDASFWGEDTNDYSGRSVTSADFNCDGYSDILIGAYNDDDGGSNAGQTYLIFGKASGWAMDTDLSTADASFWGEDPDDFSGMAVADAGDVDNDGYNDVLIGAYGDDDGGLMAGHAYLINQTTIYQVQNLSLNLTSAVSGIYLSWGDAYGDPFFYGIYRGMSPDSLTRLDWTNGSNYTDTNITPGVKYYYGVTVVDPLGGESTISTTEGMIADLDTDGDGLGNMVDSDDDGDGVPDGEDFFPLDSAEWLDTDHDGTGNNADTDDDNDGEPDVTDTDPLNPLNGMQDDIDFLNTTLQDVQGTVNDIESNLTFLNSSLMDLTGNVTDMNNSLTNLISNMDGDIAGLNATLQGNISDMNNSLTNLINALSVYVTGLNITLRGDISDMNATLQGKISDMNNSLTGLINALSLYMIGMNTTLQGNISDMNASITGDIANLDTAISNLAANLDGVNMTLRTDHMALWNMLGSIDLNLTGLIKMMAENNSAFASDHKNLLNNLSGMNRTLRKDIVDLESTLSADIVALDVILNAVNTSLHVQMDALASDQQAFWSDMNTTLQEILDRMDALDLNLTQEMNDTQDLINNLNSTTLYEMKQQLNDIENRIENLAGDGGNITEILDQISELSTDIDAFKNETQNRFANITDIMATMDAIANVTNEIDTIQSELQVVKSDLDRLNTIESDLKDIDKEQGKTTENVATSSGAALGALILMVIVLVLLGMVIMTLKKGGGSAGTSIAPVSRRPPRRRSVEDDFEEDEHGTLSTMDSESDFEATDTIVERSTSKKRKKVKKDGSLKDILDDLNEK